MRDMEEILRRIDGETLMNLAVDLGNISSPRAGHTPSPPRAIGN
jgi:hypothetical protein